MFDFYSTATYTKYRFFWQPVLTDTHLQSPLWRGLVSRVVKSLLETYYNCNHVLYCDYFSTSGPLASNLAQKGVYLLSIIWLNAQGFPENLKSCKHFDTLRLVLVLVEWPEYTCRLYRYQEHVQHQTLKPHFAGVFGMYTLPLARPLHFTIASLIDCFRLGL